MVARGLMMGTRGLVIGNMGTHKGCPYVNSPQTRLSYRPPGVRSCGSE